MVWGAPWGRVDDGQKEKVRVGTSSTIRAKKNTYSVDSRLSGELVEGRLYAERLEVWYGSSRSIACRAYPDMASMTSTIAISSTLWSANLALLRTIVTGRSSFPPATFGWLTIYSENRMG